MNAANVQQTLDLPVDVGDEFYRLTVMQRDAAWREIAALKAEIARLNARVPTRCPGCLGHGYLMVPEHECSSCGGAGAVLR